MASAWTWSFFLLSIVLWTLGICKRFPENARGWRAGAEALRKAGRIAEADALSAEAEARFPKPVPAPAEQVGAA